jgi:alanyl aminopeptidase
MRFTSLVALAVTACGGPAASVNPAPAAPAPAPPAPPAPPAAPTLRLGDAVVPTHYTLDLQLDPSAASFDGSVDIDVDLKRATTGIWLNANEIKVHAATVDDQAARVLPSPAGDDQHLGLGLDRSVGPGKAKVHIAYTGTLQTNDTAGVFKQDSGGDPYLFTQFESRDARRGFPCFDDPSFKTPWAVTLHVPAPLVAAGNNPIVSETPEAGGMKAVRFAETRPLPSYLVAFAVGPFDIVDGGHAKGGAPIRILALKGRGAEAAWAAESTRPILDTLEDYLGTPYPFDKLDEVAIPKTVAFGAMENPGLVTYNETVLLARPDDDTVQRRHAYAGVAAHELGHMWFGDLVTLAWWNDTWLNESFANWVENKAIARWQPSWGADVEAVVERSRALGSDSLTTARAVRQPIQSENDIVNAFDPGTTYGKGAALLRMFEAWVGPEAYQKGVRQYLHDHAYGNATADDFFAAISQVAGKDVAPTMKTFLDQAGAPLVHAQLVCSSGARPRLELTQRRYVLVGEAADERTWQIPVCARWDGGTVCTLMTQARAELELDTASCPAWIVPNAGGVGYYRSAPDAKLLAGLIKNVGRLTLAERVALIGDMTALVRAGTLPAGEALAALPALRPADDRFVAAEASSLLHMVRQSMVSAPQRPKLARFVSRLFAARARELGFTPKPGEPDDAQELRALLVPLVAVDGDEAKLQAEARRLADRWLADHTAVAPDESADVLVIAAAHGDRALFDRMVDVAKKTSDRRLRQRLIGAIGAFRDPKLHRAALDTLYLSKDFDIREVGGRRGRGARTEEDAELVLSWAQEHFDALAERMPKQGRAFLLRMGQGVCDEEKLKDYEGFFKEKAQSILGGPRTYDNVVESIRSCVALRKLQSPSVANFLKHAP